MKSRVNLSINNSINKSYVFIKEGMQSFSVFLQLMYRLCKIYGKIQAAQLITIHYYNVGFFGKCF